MLAKNAFGELSMGEIVLAAKITHVPSMFISERPGKHHGCRQEAIDGLKRIGDLCRERQVDTIVISDTHWLVNSGFHINAKPAMSGVFTSTEFPQFLSNLEFNHVGDPEFGQLLADTATKNGTVTLCHNDIPSLNLMYGTLVPLHFMDIGTSMKIVSVAGWMYDAGLDESRVVGESIAEAAKASDKRIAFLASGSLSHRIPPNTVAGDHLFKISKPFNETTDRMVLEMWKEGNSREFLEILPQYAEDCDGEGGMHDTAMLYGLLGWDSYNKPAEIVTDYFPSSGTGQCNVLFPV
jgi:3,4-dihydroxyphenylacetate 2,3-dioxygenase